MYPNQCLNFERIFFLRVCEIWSEILVRILGSKEEEEKKKIFACNQYTTGLYMPLLCS